MDFNSLTINRTWDFVKWDSNAYESGYIYQATNMAVKILRSMNARECSLDFSVVLQSELVKDVKIQQLAELEGLPLQRAHKKFKNKMSKDLKLEMAKRGEAEVMPHQRVFGKCRRFLVEHLEIESLLDFIIAKDFIDNVQIRDIKEQVTTSEKIRMLIDCLLTKNESSYKKFKDCLKESGQSSIIELLEGEERKLNEEILTENVPAEKKNSVRIKKHPTLQLRSICRPDVNTIANLSKGSLEWRICARLVAKNNIRRKMKLDGRHWKMMEFFSVIFIDNTREIRAVFFKNTVKKFYKYYRYLKLKQVYYVSGAHVTDANPKYHQRAEIELKINNKTKIKRFTGAVDFPKIGEHDFVQISELKNKQLDEFVDVIGVVNYIGEIETLKTVIKDRETKREVDMVDKSGMTVSVTFWGRHARIFSLRKNSVLALLGVKVKDWNNISLSRQLSTQVHIDPDIPEAHLLRKWYDSKGKRMTCPYVQ